MLEVDLFVIKTLGPFVEFFFENCKIFIGNLGEQGEEMGVFRVRINRLRDAVHHLSWLFCRTLFSGFSWNM